MVQSTTVSHLSHITPKIPAPKHHLNIDFPEVSPKTSVELPRISQPLKHHWAAPPSLAPQPGHRPSPKKCSWSGETLGETWELQVFLRFNMLKTCFLHIMIHFLMIFGHDISNTFWRNHWSLGLIMGRLRWIAVRPQWIKGEVWSWYSLELKFRNVAECWDGGTSRWSLHASFSPLTCDYSRPWFFNNTCTCKEQIIKQRVESSQNRKVNSTT